MEFAVASRSPSMDCSQPASINTGLCLHLMKDTQSQLCPSNVLSFPLPYISLHSTTERTIDKSLTLQHNAETLGAEINVMKDKFHMPVVSALHANHRGSVSAVQEWFR